MTESPECGQLRNDLASLRLTAAAWDRLAALADDVDPSDATTLAPLSQAVFEARVQRRFAQGRATSTLPPTKQVSILPWVGLACGGLLLAVGASLGGGLVSLAVGLLSLGVFVVAFAGSRVAHRHRGADRNPDGEVNGDENSGEDGDGDATSPAEEELMPPPAALLARLGGTVEP